MPFHNPPSLCVTAYCIRVIFRLIDLGHGCGLLLSSNFLTSILFIPACSLVKISLTGSHNIAWQLMIGHLKKKGKAINFKMDKPQIIDIIQKSLKYTPVDCKWIPTSPKFVVLGNHALGTGALQVYDITHDDGDVELKHDDNNSEVLLGANIHSPDAPLPSQKRDVKLIHEVS